MSKNKQPMTVQEMQRRSVASQKKKYGKDYNKEMSRRGKMRRPVENSIDLENSESIIKK